MNLPEKHPDVINAGDGVINVDVINAGDGVINVSAGASA